MTGFDKSLPGFQFMGTLVDVTVASGSGDWMLENFFVRVRESSARYALGAKVKMYSTSLGSLTSRTTLNEVNFDNTLKSAG